MRVDLDTNKSLKTKRFKHVHVLKMLTGLKEPFVMVFFFSYIFFKNALFGHRCLNNALNLF